jgi:hypothetical protein
MAAIFVDCAVEQMAVDFRTPVQISHQVSVDLAGLHRRLRQA